MLMVLRITELSEEEIKSFVCFLGVTPKENYLYVKRKTNIKEKALWSITSNTILFGM